VCPGEVVVNVGVGKRPPQACFSTPSRGNLWVMAGWNGVLISERSELSAWPAGPAAILRATGGRVTAATPAPWAMREGRLQERRRRAGRVYDAEPVLTEDEAVDRLYGKRTGTVVASPASPPLD
jgi:hypothetical protein